MKKLAGILAFIICASFPFSVSAQLTIIAKIDTNFNHTGKLELPLSGFGDELVDYYGVFPDQQLVSKITVCGKVGTADPLRKKIGILRLNPNASFDISFGAGGQ